MVDVYLKSLLVTNKSCLRLFSAVGLNSNSHTVRLLRHKFAFSRNVLLNHSFLVGTTSF